MNNGRDRHAIEKRYVLGEITGTRDDGTQIRRDPSIRDLAMQFGIARSVLWKSCAPRGLEVSTLPFSRSSTRKNVESADRGGATG
jgi:hypothetical protein